ncbi:MetQ/NlpA family ABC transporter substrate-binding protein [Eubacteriales bacterium OttesenSCG-928-N13]|nr:MetQ/NlpA family ABC transporter substrate-binding protein [Eubacteriales bacterium OttesenSCG-928-N13]
MKKLFSLLVVLALVFSMSAALAEGAQTLVIGATPSPHAEILEFIKDDLAALGYNLEIMEFTEYPLPNPALADGEIAANYFQHIPYLNAYNVTVDADKALIPAIGVHYEPYAVYPGKTKTMEELQDGAVITITNDPSNETRALLLLQEAGLISLPEGATVDQPYTVMDIENPRGFDIREVDASQLPATLSDADISVINGNFALGAGLSPATDSIFMEAADSEAGKIYTNYVVVRPEDQDAQWVQDLRSVICSEKVRDYILSNPEYQGGVIPAFTVE